MNDYLKTSDIRGLDKFGFDVSTLKMKNCLQQSRSDMFLKDKFPEKGC